MIVYSHRVTTVRNVYIGFYTIPHMDHDKNRGQSVVFQQLMCKIVDRHLSIILF
jgi:hypothetical protein